MKTLTNKINKLDKIDKAGLAIGLLVIAPAFVLIIADVLKNGSGMW